METQAGLRQSRWRGPQTPGYRPMRTRPAQQEAKQSSQSQNSRAEQQAATRQGSRETEQRRDKAAEKQSPPRDKARRETKPPRDKARRETKQQRPQSAACTLHLMIENTALTTMFNSKYCAMILSLAAAAAMSSGSSLNSSSPLDPFDSSTSWILAEDPSNSSSEPILRTMTPDLQPATTTVAVQEVSPWDIALCVTGTLISCENALVIAVLFYTPTLRAPMFILIGSLAVADLLAGLGLILNFVFTYLVDSSVEFVTLLSVGLLISAFSASVLNILAITVDRYLSLYNALTYH
ncbi:G-protein coupled receptor 12, partial [Nibea albiflora]